MKPIAKRHASFFIKAVLASTVFCGSPLPALALTPLNAGANGQNSGNVTYPPATGYDYVSSNITFAILNGDPIGNTAGVSVDNTTNQTGTILNFNGSSVVSGSVGSTNAIQQIGLLGINNTVAFNGTDFKVGTVSLTTPGPGNTVVFIDGVTADADFDATFSNNGKLVFEGGGTVNGNIGVTNAIPLTVNSLGNASSTLTLNGTTINLGTVLINDDASGFFATGTTLQLDNPNMVFSGNVTATTADSDFLDIKNAKTFSGNIGTSLIPLHLIKVAENNPITFSDNNIYATKFEFQNNNNVILEDGVTIFGNIDSTANNTGKLFFLGNGAITALDGVVTGTIGDTNALNQIILQGGAGTEVYFNANIKAGTVAFTAPATATSRAVFNDGVTITANIDSLSSNNVGLLNFQGAGAVTGIIGSTNSLAAINLAGAGKTVSFGNNVNLTGNINFAPGSTITSKATLADGFTLTGGIDNTSGTPSIGVFEFLGSGSVIASALTGATGNIGATSPINLLTINSTGGANELVNLEGAIINATTINVNDDLSGVFAQGTTLQLNNSAMVLTGKITATTANEDTLDILKAASLTGDIGTLASPFNLIKVGQNGNTTINGNIFSTLTEFQGDNTLTLGNNFTITGPVDTTVASTGTLNFAGTGTVTGNVGATNKLNTLSLSGASGVATFQGTARADNLYFLPSANSITKAVFNDVVTLDQIDNKTGTNGNGNVFFGSSGGVGAIGATNSLNELSLTGAGKTVLFGGPVNANSLTFSGTANATTTAKFAQDLTIATIDNTTAADGNGTVILAGMTNVVTGNVGATHQLNKIEIQGGGATVEFKGTVNTANFEFSVNASAATTATFDTAVTLNDVDNTTGADGNGVLTFLSNATLQGPVGATNSLNKINILGAGSTIDFQSTVNSDNIIFAPNANALTTAKFEVDVLLDNIDNTGASDGLGNLVFLGTGVNKVSGTVGATKGINNIDLRGAGGSVEFVGVVKANNLLFSNNADNTTTALFDAPITLSKIDNLTGTDGNGVVTFVGASTITGTVGQTNNLGTLNLAGAGIIVDFQDVVKAQNLIFQTGATNTTTAQFEQTAFLGTIDNQTAAAGNGIVTFMADGIVTGAVGATHALNTINLQGPSSTVNFAQNINTGSFLFSGTADDATIATLNDNVILTGNIDNMTGTTGFGTVTFLGNGTVNGTIGFTNALNAVNLQGPLSTVNFNGNVLNNTPIILLTTATANVGDGVTLNTSVDNKSGFANTGNLSFVGNSTVTGDIGATSPLNLITINSQLANKTVIFKGSVVNASNILLNDDGATATTLTLNNAGGMVLTSDITARTDNTDILNIINPTDIIGNIGSLNQKLNLIKIGGNTSLTGNVFSYDTQFQGNQTLTIGNNSILNTPITTLNNNQGTLLFTGSGAIISQVGAPGLILNAVNINGTLPSLVTLNNNIYATNTTINNGGSLLVNGVQTINGNLSVNNGVLSLADNAMPLTITGIFNLNNGTTLDVDLGGDLTSGNIVAGTANIYPNAMLTLQNLPLIATSGETIITIVSGGPSSFINAIPVAGNNLLLNFSTEADNINHKLNLVVDVISPSQFADQSNTQGIANALNNLARDPYLTGTLQEILQNLLRVTTVEELNSALAQLAPTVDGGILYESYNTNLETFDIISSQLNNRFYSKVRQLAAIRELRGMNSGDEPEPNRGTWLKAFGQYADQDERQGVDGYRNNMWGLALGGDLVITDDLLLGVSFSYATADLKNHVSTNSRTDIDSYQMTLYGQYLFECPFYVNAFASYGYNQYNLFRNVSFGDLFITPEADFHGWQYSAKAEAGYSLAIENYFITPFVGMYYSRLTTTEYTEIGVGNANQKVNSADFNILQSSAGIKLATDFVYLSSNVQPEIHAAAFYNIVNDNMALTSQFTGAGPNFATVGFKPPRASYDLGVSLTSTESDLGIVATVSYDYEMKENYNAHAGFFRVRYEW